jgi:hypothetical protein
VASILGGWGHDPQILKLGVAEGVGGSWRVWFQVFYAVKGRDGNPGPPSFETRLTPLLNLMRLKELAL